jgi:hypothetical protein
MNLLLDTSAMSFTVGLGADAKRDMNGVQKLDRSTQQPLWTVQLVAMDASGAEAIKVTLAAAQAPQFTQGQPVTPVNLQAIPWAQGDRHGVAFRAEQIKPAAIAKTA